MPNPADQVRFVLVAPTHPGNIGAAARALISDLRDGIPQAVAAETYVREATRLARPYRGFTQLTASLLRSPLRGMLLPALSFATRPGPHTTSGERTPPS